MNEIIRLPVTEKSIYRDLRIQVDYIHTTNNGEIFITFQLWGDADRLAIKTISLTKLFSERSIIKFVVEEGE